MQLSGGALLWRVLDNLFPPKYLYPTDPGLWEILEDPTGMAYITIYGNGKNKLG